MKSMKYAWFALLALLALGTVSQSLLLWGQVNLGSVKGETEDAQHAAVPGAKLTLKNEATGVVQTTTSSSSGDFSILNVAPGLYTLSAEAAETGSNVEN